MYYTEIEFVDEIVQNYNYNCVAHLSSIVNS